MNIGKLLKFYRKKKNLSQESLSEKAGINEKYYGKIERNESCPTVNILIKICYALEIDILELFLYSFYNSKNYTFYDFKIIQIITNALKNNVNIHFNTECLIPNYEDCLWYNGYIGSILFDEFELKLYATGNIKGELFINYESVLKLNGEDIYVDLIKYIKSDKQLLDFVEYDSFDEEIFKEKKGNVLFLDESNWLEIQLVNNNTEECLYRDIIETTNIIDIFLDTKNFIKFIFKENNKIL